MLRCDGLWDVVLDAAPERLRAFIMKSIKRFLALMLLRAPPTIPTAATRGLPIHRMA